MNTVSKTSSLQAYTLLLIKKAVHPEFFGIESRRRIEHGDYDVEAWIFRGGHVVRFQQHPTESPTAGRGEASGRIPGQASGQTSGQNSGQTSGQPSTRGSGTSRSTPSLVVPTAGGVSSSVGATPLAGSAAGKPSNGNAGGAAGGAACVCEIVTDQAEQIPDRGMLSSFPCAGERDHEEKIADGLLYMTTIQTETLSEHLYVGTYKEMMQHGREANSLVSAWTDENGRPNLSLLDVQRYRNEVHVQAYHLRSDCGLVLRTQSMFQVDARPAR